MEALRLLSQSSVKGIQFKGGWKISIKNKNKKGFPEN